MAPAQQQAGLSPGPIEGADTCNTRVWCCNLCGKRTVTVPDAPARTHYAVVHEVAVAAGKRMNSCATATSRMLGTASDGAAAGVPLRGLERLHGTMLFFVPVTRSPSTVTMEAQLDYHRAGRTASGCAMCAAPAS